jgi:dTDP-4-amino-4,6-dideoxygalactose transaminase
VRELGEKSRRRVPATRASFLPFSPPSIGEEEIAEVVATLRSGWLSTGPRAHRFEQEFAQYVGAPTALAVNSGTAALHLALAALGVGPGDEVIVPTLTFASGAHVVEHVGARPLLVDVEPDTLNIDLAQVEQILARGTGTGRVRAIMPTHLYGQSCDLDWLDAIAQKHKVDVIEDAAHALPSRWGNRTIGSVRLSGGGIPNGLTAFSFYATKNLTTGEGGMLTGPQSLIDRARMLSLHGMTHDAHTRYAKGGTWEYDVVAPGFKYNLSDLQAAMGIHQLARLPEHHARRAAVAARYIRQLGQLPELQVPNPVGGSTHAWHLFVIRLNLDRLTIDRARFIEELRARNIGSSVHFIPLHSLTYHRQRYAYSDDDFPVASSEFKRLVSLPLYPALTDEDVDDVIHAVTAVITRFRR